MSTEPRTVTRIQKGAKAEHATESHSSARTYRVTSESYFPPEEALTADGIPKLGDILNDGGAGDPTRWCKSKSAAPGDEEGKVYTVTAIWETAGSTEDPGTGEDIDPLGRKPEIRKTVEVSSEATFEDLAGASITNSAGEVFDPPIQREIYDPVVVVTKNESSLPLASLIAYNGAVNSDTFWGQDPRTILLRVSSVTQYEAGIKFERVTYELRIRTDGWDNRLLDQGFIELDGGEQKVITDDDGVPVPAPVRLNGSGVPLSAGASAVFLPATVLRPAIAFSSLGLPSSAGL